MKKTILFAALLVAAAFSSCSKHNDIETPVVPDPVVPEPQPLAIAFAEGNSLEFDVDETKTVHYTITGGNENNVVKVEMQNLDGAYALSTTQTSATEGTIAITAKTPETENCVLVTVSDGNRSITAEIAVSTNPIPKELAITFAEGNSLELYVNEPKTIHYTITGGSENTVVNAAMQKSDDAYAVETASTSATEGTITITAKKPETENRIIVTVSDGSQTLTAEINVTVTLKASFDGKTAVVVTPGTLSQLLANSDKSAITELTVIGNLNSSDISTLKNLPNLAILDMENANLEVLPKDAFKNNKSLTSVKLPSTLKTIGFGAFAYCSHLISVTIGNSVTSIKDCAFWDCTSLTSITIPDSVTSIGEETFSGCSGLTSVTIPNSVTSIGGSAFYGCSSLTSVTIGNSVTTIEYSAFASCSNLTSIYCKAQTPPTIESTTFSYWSKCTLYVPIGCKEAYAAADYWKQAKEIIEIEF